VGGGECEHERKERDGEVGSEEKKIADLLLDIM